jgi:hypothetical protein
MDDVPEIQLSRGEHGSPSNPHRVRSPSALVCLECGENLSAILVGRMVEAARRAREAIDG